jgi:hypothetical protein
MSTASTPYLAASHTLAFLRRWFARCPKGQLAEVRPLNKRPGARPKAREWFDSFDRAFDQVSAAFANGDDVYVGALARRQRAGTAAAVGDRV